MPDLETLLREVRPAPDPAWAARLDTRVAAPVSRPAAALEARRFIALREHFLAFGAVGDGRARCSSCRGRRRPSRRRRRRAAAPARRQQRPGTSRRTPSDRQRPETRRRVRGAPKASTDRRRSAGAAAGDGAARAVRAGPRREDQRRRSRSRPRPARCRASPTARSSVVDSLGGYVQSSQVEPSGAQRERRALAADPVGAPRRRPRPAVEARAREGALAADPGPHRPARGARGLGARRARRPRRPARPARQGDHRQGALAAARPARPRDPPRHPAPAPGRRARSRGQLRERRRSRSRATAAPAPAPRPAGAGRRATRSATPCACSRSSPACS